jgi:hypothetical protein
MPLRNFVPNANKEERTIGTLLKKWLKGFFYDLSIEHNLTDETNSVTVAQIKTASDNEHTHSNKTNLDNVSGINTGDQDLSGKVDKITDKGLSANDYTNDEKTKLDAISGTNTGDETSTSIKSKLSISTLSGSNTGDQDLSGKVDKITGKGLSANDYTNDEKTKLDAISGTNTGDETSTSIKSKLSISTLSGSNTGDQDLSGKVDKITDKGLSANDYTNDEKTKLDAISGTNTGDETSTSIKSKLSISTLSGSNTGDQDLSGKVDKITDKGLSANDFTNDEKSKLDNISGSNYGDETNSTIITKIGFTPENSANKNQESGYAGLDSNSKLNPSQLPSIAIIDFLGTVVSQIAMLALTGQKGDWCIRSDQSLSPMWIITGSDPTQLNNWTAIPYPAIPTLLSQLGDDSTHRLVTDTILTRLANTSGTNTGDQDLSGKVDKVSGDRLITSAESTLLGNTSGTNSGDQDLSGKVDKITGKGLSTNDYTTAEKNSLANAVPNTRTINGHALSADITLIASDIGLGDEDMTAAIASALKFEAFFNFVINGILDLTTSALNIDFNQTILKLDLGAK